MNKIKCFITGGHKYDSINLIVTEDLPRNLYIFRNRCVKCGKEYAVEIPHVNIFSEAFLKKLNHENIMSDKQTED